MHECAKSYYCWKKLQNNSHVVIIGNHSLIMLYIFIIKLSYTFVHTDWGCLSCQTCASTKPDFLLLILSYFYDGISLSRCIYQETPSVTEQDNVCHVVWCCCQQSCPCYAALLFHQLLLFHSYKSTRQQDSRTGATQGLLTIISDSSIISYTK